MALLHDFLCLVPIAIFHRALQICAVVAIKVLEDTILVLESAGSVDWRSILDGSETS